MRQFDFFHLGNPKSLEVEREHLQFSIVPRADSGPLGATVQPSQGLELIVLLSVQQGVGIPSRTVYLTEVPSSYHQGDRARGQGGPVDGHQGGGE